MNGPENNQGKPPLSILPDVLEDVARVMEIGAVKHGRHNWIEQEWELTQFYDAAQRHLLAWLRGTNVDSETGEPHLAHALANLMMLLQLDNEARGRDDRRQVWTRSGDDDARLIPCASCGNPFRIGSDACCEVPTINVMEMGGQPDTFKLSLVPSPDDRHHDDK